jgi:hypothetical protein
MDFHIDINSFVGLGFFKFLKYATTFSLKHYVGLFVFICITDCHT